MRLLLGVSGGIAAYKSLEMARLAVQAGHSVRVIQTPTSLRFVGRASFAAITGAPVLTSEFDADPARGSYPGEPVPERATISHLALVERADVFLIAPASANTLAKLAQGFADNLVTTAALAAACPVLVAPAMNNRMYLAAATQANLRQLAERGLTVIPPGDGELASYGERGVGRLPEPADLLAACERAHAQRSNGARSPLGPRAPAGACHRGRDPGADRQRQVHRQPVVREDGLCARGAGGGARRGGHRRRRECRTRGAGRSPGDSGRDRRAACRGVPRRVPGLRRSDHGRRRGRLPAGVAGGRQAQEDRPGGAEHDRADRNRGRFELTGG